MKKRKLLIALGVIVIAVAAVSCTSYVCPTYTKEIKKPEKPCLWI